MNFPPAVAKDMESWKQPARCEPKKKQAKEATDEGSAEILPPVPSSSTSVQDRLRRAIKDNNFYLVRRLVSRPDVDIRNPDANYTENGDGYTSLAWAALCGHTEIFEYLLNCGHDDAELSKDERGDTILIFLASLRTGSFNRYVGSVITNDAQHAALRMARAYHERYPTLLDWSNEQGQTAVHVAATGGNEEYVRLLSDLGADIDVPDTAGNTPLHYASSWGHSAIAQFLIERGGQYAARNNEGFTAADFAFSQNTKDEMERAIRDLIETNKKVRRARSAAAREDWSRFSVSDEMSGGSDMDVFDPAGKRNRSVSNASGTTSSVESDYGGPVQAPAFQPLRPQASQASLVTNGVHWPEPLGDPSLLSQNSATSSKGGSSMHSSKSPSSGSPATSPPDQTTFQAMETPRPFASASPAKSEPKTPTPSTISPVAHRMRERDQGAIAQYQEYMNRSRTGSASGAPEVVAAKPMPPLPTGSRMEKPRLRPSASAAVLSPGGSSSTSSSFTTPIDPRATPRVRADTFEAFATPRHRAETLDGMPTKEDLPAVPTTSGDGTIRRIVSPALPPKPGPRTKEVTPWEYSDEDTSPEPPIRRTESS